MNFPECNANHECVFTLDNQSSTLLYIPAEYNARGERVNSDTNVKHATCTCQVHNRAFTGEQKGKEEWVWVENAPPAHEIVAEFTITPEDLESGDFKIIADEIEQVVFEAKELPTAPASSQITLPAPMKRRKNRPADK